MNATSPRLETSIRSHLLPHLKADGFSGSGRTFRRVINDWIQVVNVQGSQYGGRFAINMGLQPLGVPDVSGNDPDPKQIMEPSCEFRRRLTDSGADQWWKHDATQASMDSAVTSAAEVYVRVGRPLLNRAAERDSPANSVTADDLKNGTFDFYGWGSTEVCMALVLARIRKLEGRNREAKEFCDHGLAHVGKATGLRAQLQRLSASLLSG